MIDLSVIVLSYNTKELLKNCLVSILSSIDGKFLYEIIVVDNASFDGSPEMVRKDFKKVKITENKENLGFARGCNIGVKASKGKYVLFLNSDTEVLDKGFISMTEFMDKNPKVAILGGRLENNDGSIQRSCGKFYNLFNLLIMLLGLERFGFLRSSPGKIQKVDWVSGACMMVRSDIFKKLSGFDESFFMYVEDMEICFRAKKSGFSTYFYPNLLLKHKALGSSNRSFAIINIYKGILHFYLAHRSYLEYLIAKTLLVLKARILILIGFLMSDAELRDRYRKAIS